MAGQKLVSESGTVGVISAKWPKILAGLILALLLMIWMAGETAFLQAEVWDQLVANVWTIGLIAAISAVVQTWLSAEKWNALLGLTEEQTGRVERRHIFAYTAFGHVAGQVAPAYVAGPLARSFAMSVFHGKGFARSFAIAGYDQIFDAFVLLSFGLCAGILLVFGWTSIEFIPLLLFLSFGCIATFLATPLSKILGYIADRLPPHWKFTRNISRNTRNFVSAGYASKGILSQLALLSYLRYLVFAVRTILIGTILMPQFGVALVALSFALVQLTALLSITPGNLGVTEVGWATMSELFKGPMAGELIAFALTLRVTGFVASLAVAATAAFWSLRK